jgi:hypothetical protein
MTLQRMDRPPALRGARNRIPALYGLPAPPQGHFEDYRMRKRNRARELLTKDPAIRRLLEGLPAREASNPQWVREYLTAYAELDPQFRRSEAYAASHQILHEAVQEQQLADRAAAVYHGAISKGIVTREQANRLWNDPAAAEAYIKGLQKTNPDLYWSELGQQAADVFYEVQALAAEPDDGVPDSDPEPAAPTGDRPPVAEPYGQVVQQQPASAPDIGRQIKDGLAVMRTDPRKYWSDSFQKRMTALYEQQLAAEQGETSVPEPTTTTTPRIGDSDNE